MEQRDEEADMQRAGRTALAAIVIFALAAFALLFGLGTLANLVVKGLK